MTKSEMYEMLNNIQRNYVAGFEWEVYTSFPHSEKYTNTHMILVRIFEKFSISLLDLKRLLIAANVTWNTNTFKGKFVNVTIWQSGNDTLIGIM